LRINSQVSVIDSYRQASVSNDGAAGRVDSPGSAHAGNRGDGAARLAVSGIKRANSRGLTEASRKAQESASRMQGADNKLKRAEGILQRMQKLAAQSADGETTVADRIALDYKYTQYIFEICRLGSLRFDSVDPSSMEEFVPIETLGGYFYEAAAEVYIEPIDTDALGSIGSFDDASRAVSAIDSAMSGVSDSRSRLDDAQAKLISEFRSIDAPVGMQPGAGSRVSDADAAKRMVGSMRSNMMQGPSVSAQAQANAVPQSVLQLLD
jgi:flagellin